MTQPFTVDDLHLHQRLTEIDCRPGTPVACTVRSVDRDNDAYISCIWRFGADGQARQLTSGPGRDASPRWSPQGDRLAFLSDRTGAQQLYLLPADGGEAQALDTDGLTPSAMCWMPDGQALVVACAVNVDPDWRGGRGDGKPKKRGPNSPEVAWKLPYKSDGMGYMLAREIHLLRVEAGGGQARRLTEGTFDVLGHDVAPDGRHVAYIRTREGRFAHASDLWCCDAEGGGHRRLTRGLATVMGPAWSPDGRWIAVAGAEVDGDAQSNLWLLEFATGALRRLGDASLLVASPDTLRWSPDSRSIVFAQAHQGRHRIVRMDVASGKLAVLAGGDRHLAALASDGERFYYGVDTLVQPSELWSCAADGSDERQLSHFNPWWQDRTPLELQARHFEVPDGRGGTERIQGWLLRARDAQGPQPLLDDVHGGPASFAQLDYDTQVYWHALCSQGWTVLALDPVGSASYGREFCDRLQGHWGTYDLPQHQAAIRQLQADKVCDERVAIVGKSYGGYLSAWAVGHTQEFRAAVVMAPVGNIETHYGTSDGGYYADPLYMGGSDRFDRKLARQLSPLHHIEKARTPTLFLQGKEDERCPKCQAEELFVSLFAAGDTPAELVLYPQQGHHFLGDGPPSVRSDASQRVIDWLQAHVGRPVASR